MNADDMLSSNEVMAMFGYKDRKSFWDFVRKKNVPHIRLNARVIRFERGPLEEWKQKRRSVKLPTRIVSRL